MMMAEITIRPGKLADADLVARLIYMTMGVEADWLFGQKKGHPTLQVIAGLYKRKENRLSHNLVFLAEYNQEVAGLLLVYPGGMLSRLTWMTGWCLLGIFGIPATIRLAHIQSEYGDLKETESDEFYISNLAVFPNFEGQGVGSRLMAYAEELAITSGLQKCSLIVAFGHDRAFHLYEHLGYKVVRSYLNSHPKVAEGSGGYHRMVKMLPLPPV
jgi:ribosomal protein S18 acetylase RimI-like enzyme